MMGVVNPRHPTTTPARRPAWPFPDITISLNGREIPASLTAHPNGQWVKKHDGKQYRFGVWRDAAGTDRNELARRALARFRAQWPMIVRGVTPSIIAPPRPGSATVRRVCERWAAAQHDLYLAGKLAKPTYVKYINHANAIAEMLGYDTVVESLGQTDFRRLAGLIAQRYAVSAQGDVMVRVRAIMRWAKAEGLIAAVPEFGLDFRGPRARDRKAHRQRAGRKSLDRLLIRVMLSEANQSLKAAILLGINGAFGEEDCRWLRRSMIDGDGLIDTTRTKTGETRVVPLWPETLAALESCWDSEGRFVNHEGRPWALGGVSKQWTALKRSLWIADPGGHYWLRHTLRTIGGRCSRDGARLIMGQQVGDIDDETYDHDHDARIAIAKAVSSYVHAWLYHE